MADKQNENEGWRPLMPFLIEGEPYVLGFEAGRVWGMCENKQWPDHMLAHTAQTGQFHLIAKHFNCDIFIDKTTEAEWCEITFVEQPKRAGLHLVPNELNSGAAEGGPAGMEG